MRTIDSKPMTPKCIPIPSDLVLKVCINDLYDQDAEAIDITDLSAIKLTFAAGGASVDFELNPSDSSNDTDGASIVTSSGGDPYILVCLCTNGLKPGQLTLRSEVTIPDDRFHDGERKEVDEFVFPIILT